MQSIHGLDIPICLADLATPKKMALLVYDMQAGICRQVESERVTAAAGAVLGGFAALVATVALVAAA